MDLSDDGNVSDVIQKRPSRMTVMKAVNKVSRHIISGMVWACNIYYVSNGNQTWWRRQRENPYNPTCLDREAIPGPLQGSVMNMPSYFDICFPRFTARFGTHIHTLRRQTTDLATLSCRSLTPDECIVIVLNVVLFTFHTYDVSGLNYSLEFKLLVIVIMACIFCFSPI